MKSKGSQINTNSLRNAIGAEMMECLPFAYDVSGCDTTSTFGQGKLKALKLLEKSRELREKVLIFGEDEATHEQIKVVGEDFIKQLDHSGKSRVKSLDELRELLYKSPKYLRMAPTSWAAFYHCYVHVEEVGNQTAA